MRGARGGGLGVGRRAGSGGSWPAKLALSDRVEVWDDGGAVEDVKGPCGADSADSDRSLGRGNYALWDAEVAGGISECLLRGVAVSGGFDGEAVESPIPGVAGVVG
jgi:hypothetical protein